MTTQEKKKVAAWILGSLVLPFLLFGAKKYDQSKVDTSLFDHYRDQQAATQALHDLRDSARLENISHQIEYLTCRQDFSRRECLRPDRP